MQAFSRHRDNALGAWLQKVHCPSLANGSGEPSALDRLDAFVMAHAALAFDEFFSRLRQLDAWHALLASQDIPPSRSPVVSPGKSVVRELWVREQKSIAEKEKMEKVQTSAQV